MLICVSDILLWSGKGTVANEEFAVIGKLDRAISLMEISILRYLMPLVRLKTVLFAGLLYGLYTI